MSLARLNLGAGLGGLPGFVNVDLVALPGVDVVADLDQPPWPFADASAGYIVASHVFEHLDQPVMFMAEAWRVLAPDGVLDIRVPYYKHWSAFTDPTHKRFCTELTFDYWCPGAGLHDAYGLAYGSPPVCFTRGWRLNNDGAELQAVLRKVVP